MMPERDWTWLKAIKARLHAAAPAHAPTGRVITSLQLLDLGQQLMDESKPALGAPISTYDAIRYRDGLMAAFVAGQNERAAEIYHRLMPLVDALFVTSSPIPLKYALNKIGMRVGGTRLPLVPIDARSQALMDAALNGARIDLEAGVPA